MAKPLRALALVAVAALGLVACTDSPGGGGKTLIISSDLPLQGSPKDASDATNKAIALYLSQVGGRAGKYTVAFKTYDNSTAAAGQWDATQCQKNGAEHVRTKDEVAVMGNYDSGCAKLMVPILGRDGSNPLLMVSHANTNPGLTKAWDAGEPAKYYPGGKRNFARVVTTDEVQGQAAANFVAKDLGVRKVYVLNDGQAYGRGVAKTFSDAAKAAGVAVAANDQWDVNAANYTVLMQRVKASGADAVYLAGTFDEHGGQLVRDKVAVVGDNATVKLIAPDGFTGYPQLSSLAEAQGMYLTFPGLSIDQLRAKGGAGTKLLDAYRAKYGTDPASTYAVYGVAAVQVILAAIEKSDGTRKGVTQEVFSGDGVTVPADVSVLGKELKINPKTGDVNVKDVTVEVIKGNAEVFLTTESVS